VTHKDRFRQFLEQHFPARVEHLLSGFENYLDLLYDINQRVNLVSRQMPKDNYWLYHFLDSLLIVNCMDLSGEKILDFGSGGGLPGIPLKLAFPDLKLTLLDSVSKKIRCLEQMISELKLQNCRAVWNRLEDFATSARTERYDLILCRSVKLESGFIEPLHKLLKPGGKAVFYKAQSLDDVSVLDNIEVHDVSLPELGQRRIVTAPKQSLKHR